MFRLFPAALMRWGAAVALVLAVCLILGLRPESENPGPPAPPLPGKPDPTPSPEPVPATTTYRIGVSTIRDREAKDGSRFRFGTKPGPLTHWKCTVSVGRQYQAGRLDDIAIRSMRETQGPGNLSEESQSASAGDVLIFIHGFNVGFEESIKRVTQIVHEYGYRGTVILFAWPSLCRLGSNAYRADRKTIDDSVTGFTEFLREVSGRYGGRRIQILAHSLACRLVGRAAAEHVRNHPEPTMSFANIVLASPDVDVEQFTGEFKAPLMRISDRVTIYHSKSDTLLNLAVGLNKGRPRLGCDGLNSKPRTGVEVVDFSLLGGYVFAHNFYREHPVLVKDICAVLRDVAPKSHRQLLAP